VNAFGDYYEHTFVACYITTSNRKDKVNFFSN